MNKITVDYFNRVDKFIDKNPEVCRECGFCITERQYYGDGSWEYFLNCDVLEGTEPECPRVPVNPGSDEDE